MAAGGGMRSPRQRCAAAGQTCPPAGPRLLLRPLCQQARPDSVGQSTSPGDQGWCRGQRCAVPSEVLHPPFCRRGGGVTCAKRPGGTCQHCCAQPCPRPAAEQEPSSQGLVWSSPMQGARGNQTRALRRVQHLAPPMGNMPPPPRDSKPDGGDRSCAPTRAGSPFVTA